MPMSTADEGAAVPTPSTMPEKIAIQNLLRIARLRRSRDLPLEVSIEPLFVGPRQDRMLIAITPHQSTAIHINPQATRARALHTSRRVHTQMLRASAAAPCERKRLAEEPAMS